MKTFDVKYKAAVVKAATVEAEDLEDAKERFHDGEFLDRDELDCFDIELIEIKGDLE